MPEMLPQGRKTLIGNPTGQEGGRKFNPNERMGGIDVGGSMGRMFENVPAETPEQRKAAREASRAEEERIMNEWRAKIGDRPNTETPSVPRVPKRNEAVMIPAAEAQAMLAAIKAAQEEKNKPKSWRERWFGAKK